MKDLINLPVTCLKKLQAILMMVLIVLFFGACNNETPITQSTADSQRIEEVLSDAINVMQRNSINRLTIDWTDFRGQVNAAVGDGPFQVEVENGLRKALSLLADNHSFVIMPNGNFISESQVRCNGFSGLAQDIPSDIGYVKVRSFSGNTEQARSYIREIRNQIREQDDAGLKGWIIDNRGNTGGNMYPMIAGIGEIIGEGTLGYFIGPEGGVDSWGYSNHSSFYNSSRLNTAEDQYELLNPQPKVAVLSDNGVASSGEVVAISFIGRDNTRSFGVATCGLSTANSRFQLSHDVTLLLTVSTMADRNQVPYGQEITPDEVVSNAVVVDRAIEWLREN